MDGDGSQGGIPMWIKARFDFTSVGIQECLDNGPLVGCVSSTSVLLTQIQNHMMEDTPTKSCLITRGKKGKIY